MLDSVLLLLRLSDAATKNRPRFEKSEDDVPRKRPPERDDYGLMSGDEITCPLVPFLRRLGAITAPTSAELAQDTSSTVSLSFFLVHDQNNFFVQIFTKLTFFFCFGHPD